MNTIIWIIQGILAAAFLTSGMMKVTLSKEKVKENQGGWAADFNESQIKLIGSAEVLGALGLILPMLLNILPVLTPVAALGLGTTMIGAAVTHLKRKESFIPVVVILLLAILVFVGRIFIVPVVL
jgi:hypothetical protein